MNYRKQWEDYHGIKIPDGWQIHHWLPRSCGGDDRMTNLVACPVKAHHKFHVHRGDKVSAKFISTASHAGKNNGMYGRTGINSPNYGKKMSEAHKAKISSAKMGIARPEEVKRKVSNTMLERGTTKGSNNPFFGKKHTIQTKMKMKLTKSKTVREVIKWT